MPLTAEEHLDNLIRHIDRVRDACTLLGKHLLSDGQYELGRMIIARGHTHDVSKLYGIEWEYLHAGRDVPKTKLSLAIEHHVKSNDHHIEFWRSIEEMPRIAVYEMVADWLARAQEFGTDLREWINKEAIKRYKIKKDSQQYRWITEAVDILLENHFV